MVFLWVEFAEVGNDEFGKMLVEAIKKNEISTEGIVVSDDVFTTLAFVTFDEKNDRHFSFARKPGADTRLTAEKINTDLIDDAKVFHFGTLSLTDEPSFSATHFAVEYAKQQNKLISFDHQIFFRMQILFHCPVL